MKDGLVAALLVVVIILSAAGGYYGGVSNQRTVTSTSTQTTTTSVIGAENQCGYVTTCDVFNSAGLELTLSINSTNLKPEAAIALSVTESNPLPVARNISSSADWALPGLNWVCGPEWYPHGIAVFRGYYTLGNISAAHALNFWATLFCPLPLIVNGTRGTPPNSEPIFIGGFRNVTSYSFMPESSNASFVAYFSPSDNGTVVLGRIIPTNMQAGTFISATYSPYPYYNSINTLGSDAPAVYTLAAGDEWGDLVLLHFSVT